MTGILITFNLASIVFLTWVFAQGYFAGAEVAMRAHIIGALSSTALSVFAHSMTMMYLAATSRMIREAVEKGGLDAKYVAEAKGYRSKVFRFGMMAVLAVMANTVLAGGAHTHMFPIWVHNVLSILALSFNAYAVYLEVRYLIVTHLLGHKVAQLYDLPQSHKEHKEEV
jgi:hypothetical protein